MADMYFVRIQLVAVEKYEDSIYTDLHSKLEAADFYREFQQKDKIFKLPHAQYVHWADGTNPEAVLEAAKKIADEHHKPGCRIVVWLSSKFAHRNLEERPSPKKKV